MERERWMQLAREGDHEAGLALWNEARRRHDASMAREAAQGMGDFERLFILFEAAWAEPDEEELRLLAAHFGLVLEPTLCAQLDAALDGANGRQRNFRIERAALLDGLIRCRLERRMFTLRVEKADESAGDSKAPSVLFVRSDTHCVVSFFRAGGGQTQSRVLIPSCESGFRGALPQAGLRGARRVALERILSATPSLRSGRDLLRALNACGVELDEALRERVRSTMQAIVESLEDPWSLAFDHHRLWLQGERCSVQSMELTSHSVQLTDRGRAPGVTHPLSHWVVKHGPRLRQLSLELHGPRSLAVLLDAGIFESITSLSIKRALPFDAEWVALLGEVFSQSRGLQHLSVLQKGNAELLYAALKRTRGLRSLQLSSRGLGYARCERLLNALQNNALEFLDLSDTEMDGAALGVLFSSHAMSRLRRLHLNRCSLPFAALRGLGKARFAGSIERLELCSNPTGAWFALLCAALELPRLQSLNLSNAQGAGELQVSPLSAPNLRDLVLDANPMDEGLFEALLGVVARSELTRLSLNRCSLASSLGALRRHPWPLALAELSLNANGFGDAGMVALLGTLSERLERLMLAENGLGSVAMKALAKTSLQLQVLDLEGNPLQTGGVRALLSWPNLGQVQELHLGGCKLGKTVRGLLESSPLMSAWVSGVEGLDWSRAWASV
ncbi:MAG: hypothetical protein RBU37_24910 [Myxococcota bacterium]|nr:hypothetical protein [Myxococcota bacterium]